VARVASLHVYPVKSCRGIDVESFRVTDTGPEWDRRWMIVTAAGGRFISQRTHPAMARIAVSIGAGGLRLAGDGIEPLTVPLDHGGDARRVTVWKDECLGIDAGEEAADWLAAMLGEALRLVRLDPTVPRLANASFAGPDPQPVSFADAYPVLMISRESLAALNRRLPEPIPMARFRPNVVIEGVAPHAEDAMTRFRFGPLVLRGVKHCTRCPITTTDQQSGARDPHQEPLRTLGKYRHDYALKGVTFGQNCVVEAGVGERLRVGAEVTIDEGTVTFSEMP
jgi:uncharacterized protein YcbX